MALFHSSRGFWFTSSLFSLRDFGLVRKVMMEVAKAMGLDGRRCCLLDTFLKGASIRILYLWNGWIRIQASKNDKRGGQGTRR